VFFLFVLFHCFIMYSSVLQIIIFSPTLLPPLLAVYGYYISQ